MSIDAGPDQPLVGPAPGTVRLRLDLAYEGTDFHGWAAQPGLRTVQAELEAALAQVLRASVRLVIAGRTDAGVHARGQVAHVDVEASAIQRQRLGRRYVGPGQAGPAAAGRSDDGPVNGGPVEGGPVEGGAVGTGGSSHASSAPAVHHGEGPHVPADVGAALVRRLAGVLPPDVRVRRVTVAPPGFDARFGALWRRYTYRLCDAPGGPDPLLRRHVVTAPRTLDVEAMAEAARGLLGEHDFAAYCRRREGATTVRTLLDLDWRREAGQFGELIVAGVRADAFCHNQVRAMVGACLAVGEGRRDVGWPARVLLAGVRDPRVTVAPAHGLTLEEVAYPDDAELAARSVLTRRRRTLPERAATPGESG